MNRHLPTEDQVRSAMTGELADAEATGRRATVTVTVTNIERQLGVTHAAFYRNYPDLIESFKAQLAARRDEAVTEKDATKREKPTAANS
ncbi:hypothetical protein ACFCWG_29240 [Streptomyces sp. NPDC056390]|uniref:hypothetical protein n=1 Tax=Streptomyces sp. NPDC056390 TaxID=3345806 RepID=UPI0035E1384E